MDLHAAEIIVKLTAIKLALPRLPPPLSSGRSGFPMVKVKNCSRGSLLRWRNFKNSDCRGATECSSLQRLIQSRTVRRPQLLYWSALPTSTNAVTNRDLTNNDTARAMQGSSSSISFQRHLDVASSGSLFFIRRITNSIHGPTCEILPTCQSTRRPQEGGRGVVGVDV